MNKIQRWPKLDEAIGRKKSVWNFNFYKPAKSSPVDRVNSKSKSNPSPSQVAESLVIGLFITKI